MVQAPEIEPNLSPCAAFTAIELGQPVLVRQEVRVKRGFW